MSPVKVSYVVAPDQESVLMLDASSNQSARVPLHLATVHWLRTISPTVPIRYVVMTYAFQDGSFPMTDDNCMMVMISESDAHPVPWPAWHPRAQGPKWVPVPTREWRRLPSLHPDDSCCDILRAQSRSSEMDTREKAQQIQSRCEQIVKDGDTENHTDSLEYYTTVRVKHAYLQMNSEGLFKRIESVQKCLSLCGAVLEDLEDKSPFAIHWKPPEFPPEVDTLPDDPNALCYPALSDYDVHHYARRLLSTPIGVAENGVLVGDNNDDSTFTVGGP